MYKLVIMYIISVFIQLHNLFYGTVIHAIKRKNKYFKIGNISRTKSDERQTEISLEFLLIFVRKSRNIGEIKNNVQHI